MTRTELIIQLLKVAIGLAFCAYFVWWSLEVLDRLTPDSDVPTAVVGSIMKVPAAPENTRGSGRWPQHKQDRTPTHGYEPTREAAMTAFAKSWRRE
jgi:hypothetical protein